MDTAGRTGLLLAAGPLRTTVASAVKDGVPVGEPGVGREQHVTQVILKLLEVRSRFCTKKKRSQHGFLILLSETIYSRPKFDPEAYLFDRVLVA